MLSHDLLEGIFARAGLASDIEVVEEFPSRYDVAAARQHRWVRGDWQLLPWIFGFGGKTRDGSRKTAIPLMGRWKLLDNLRRSLSAPAALLAMLLGWALPLTAALIWTAYILATIALPPLLSAIAGIVPRRAGVSLRNHLRGLRGDFALGILQSIFLITFLAHQAWLMVDAVGRTLFRLSHSPPLARMGHRGADHRRRAIRYSHAFRADRGQCGFCGACGGGARFRRAIESGRSPCRSAFCGFYRRLWRAGRACRRAPRVIFRSRKPTHWRYG